MYRDDDQKDQEFSQQELDDFAQSEANEEVIRQGRGDAPLDPMLGVNPATRAVDTDPEWQEQLDFEPASSPSRHGVPKSVEECESYEDWNNFARQFLRPFYGPTNASDVQTVREGVNLARFEVDEQRLTRRLVQSEAEARKKYGPDFDKLIDRYVIPACRDDIRLAQIIRWMPDPGEAAYRLAILAKHNGRLPPDVLRRWKSLSQEERDKMSPEDLETMLKAREWGHEAGEGHDVEFDQLEDREAMLEMNGMGVKDFERALDAWKSRPR